MSEKNPAIIAIKKPSDLKGASKKIKMKNKIKIRFGIFPAILKYGKKPVCNNAKKKNSRVMIAYLIHVILFACN